MSEITTWIENRLPDTWYDGAPSISVDREEIVIIGRLAPVEAPKTEEGEDESHVSVAEEARIARFREETRRQRMRIADETEDRFGRKVSWGAACGDTSMLFTTISVPVMTRLRQSERQVLDTLVAAGVARSRSDALGWCVRLVADHEGDWIERLRESLKAVHEARAEGPSPGRNARSSSGKPAPPQA